MLASAGCPFGRYGSNPRQVQSSRPTGAFACRDPPLLPKRRWIRAQWVTQKGNPKKVDPNNACGLNIGVQKGTVQADEDLPAKSKACTDAGKPAINAIVDGDQGKVTTSVLSGKADAMLADSPIGLYAVKQTNGQLEALGQIYDAAPYGFVVAKDQKDFADAIASALKAIGTSGEYKAALAKWGNESGGITTFAVNP